MSKGVTTRAAAEGSAAPKTAAKGPPNILWRVFAALMYLVPWVDIMMLDYAILGVLPSFFVLHLIPGRFSSVYFSSQFAPLIIFFLLFLAVVKNTRLAHFVRFATMQAIMLDIAVMLFVILRNYLPSEIRWSWLGLGFDIFSWHMSMTTIIYCIIFTLMGKYPDLPGVSESVYMQVEMSNYG